MIGVEYNNRCLPTTKKNDELPMMNYSIKEEEETKEMTYVYFLQRRWEMGNGFSVIRLGIFNTVVVISV
jgi:hypothetical protein